VRAFWVAVLPMLHLGDIESGISSEINGFKIYRPLRLFWQHLVSSP
jgi:hypothetical protein